jgi:hypothetical protein
MWKTVPLVLALLALGCGDDAATPPADMAVVVQVPHNFDQINSIILSQSCASFSVCHSKAGAKSAGHLDLETDPYTALVGVAADNAKAKSEGLMRVAPCDSAHSFLLTKLKLTKDQDPTTGYGHHMPDTNPSLPDAQIQAIADWIDRGAIKNEPATVTGNQCAASADM